MAITRTITLPDRTSTRLQIMTLAEAQLTGGLFIFLVLAQAAGSRVPFLFSSLLSSLFLDAYTAFFSFSVV
jgi:hypothetical protein